MENVCHQNMWINQEIRKQRKKKPKTRGKGKESVEKGEVSQKPLIQTEAVQFRNQVLGSCHQALCHSTIFSFFLFFLIFIYLYFYTAGYYLPILYILVYICQSQSPNSSHQHHLHPNLPPLVSISLFSTSVSLFLSCKPVHLYPFSRFHIYVFIYDICFPLSDLLHSVWQSLGPSMSLQMTQFRSFVWLSNIPLYICTISSLSIHLSMGI